MGDSHELADGGGRGDGGGRAWQVQMVGRARRESREGAGLG